MNNNYKNIAKFYEICLPDFWLPFTRLLKTKIPFVLICLNTIKIKSNLSCNGLNSDHVTF